MTDHSAMKLGKRPVKIDGNGRTLKLGKYLTSGLPPAPASVDYSKLVVTWGMHLNGPNSFGEQVPSGGVGDCTIAAVANAIECWTANVGREVIVVDADVLKHYELWDGYNPADPSTDQGGVEIDVLKAWRQQGFLAAATPVDLDAFAALNPLNSQMVCDAVWLFGGIYIGLELPITAQTQDVWSADPTESAVSKPGSWGGHAVQVVGFDATTLTLITWGAAKKMTWQFFEMYCSEAYALVSKSWLKATSLAPSGFNLAQLEKDLAVVTA